MIDYLNTKILSLKYTHYVILALELILMKNTNSINIIQCIDYCPIYCLFRFCHKYLQFITEIPIGEISKMTIEFWKAIYNIFVVIR